MRNFGGEAFVVHEEKVDLLGIGDQELLEAVGEKVPGLKLKGRQGGKIM